jgi:hypothetical protein
MGQVFSGCLYNTRPSTAEKIHEAGYPVPCVLRAYSLEVPAVLGGAYIEREEGQWR